MVFVIVKAKFFTKIDLWQIYDKFHFVIKAASSLCSYDETFKKHHKIVFSMTKKLSSPKHNPFCDKPKKKTSQNMAIDPLAQLKPKTSDENKCHKSSGPTQTQK